MNANPQANRNFRVKITQAGTTLLADGTRTILDLAQSCDIDYPSGCESGICGACKSVLCEGSVELLPHSVQALSPLDRENGLVLACRSLPKSDLEIAWLDPDDLPPPHKRQNLIMRVASVERLTHDIVRLRLEAAGGGRFLFTPGQSANIRVEGIPARPYSMASQPDDSFVEFHVRKVPGGRLSTHIFDGLTASQMVGLDGPFGASYLREGHAGPIIALAGGSGLAPIVSVVTAALQSDPKRMVTLLHGVRDEADVYFTQELSALSTKYPTLKVVTVLSDVATENVNNRSTGFLSDALDHFELPIDGAKAYLAGPPPMVEACIVKLIERGIERKDCHADSFVTADIL